MAKMFYREDDGFYGSWAETALQGATDEERAFVLNLLFDHRVPFIREAQFRQLCHDLQGDLKDAATQYHELWILANKDPDFADPTLNKDNFVDVQTYTGDALFVNVLDLNGLRRVITGIQDPAAYPQLDFNSYRITFRDRNDDHLPQRYNDWLDVKLASQPLLIQQSFVGEILRLLGDLVKKDKPRNPIWVAPFDEFRQFLGRDDDQGRADRWRQALGLRLEGNRWQVLVSYSCEQLGGKLYRPTQLDAGFYGWHFPSQVLRTVARGGQAMGWGDCACAVVTEYIHKQFAGLNESNIIAIAKTSATKTESLTVCRRRHRETLPKIDLDADDPAWYPVDIIQPGV